MPPASEAGLHPHVQVGVTGLAWARLPFLWFTVGSCLQPVALSFPSLSFCPRFRPSGQSPRRLGRKTNLGPQPPAPAWRDTSIQVRMPQIPPPQNREPPCAAPLTPQETEAREGNGLLEAAESGRESGLSGDLSFIPDTSGVAAWSPAHTQPSRQGNPSFVLMEAPRVEREAS